MGLTKGQLGSLLDVSLLGVVYWAQDYRIRSLRKRSYINENRHENGISNYSWENKSAEILLFSRIMF